MANSCSCQQEDLRARAGSVAMPTQDVDEKWDCVIPRISSKELTVESFYGDFMLKNRPVLITDITEGWEALKWVQKSKLNSTFIKETFGESQVTIHNCTKHIQDLGRLETTEMTVRNYLEWWDASRGSDSGDVLYLKDWNFCKEHPG